MRYVVGRRDADILPQLLCSCEGIDYAGTALCSYALMVMLLLSYSTHALCHAKFPSHTLLVPSAMLNSPLMLLPCELRFMLLSLQLCIANSPCCTTLPFDLRHARSNSCGSNCSSPACVKNKIKLFRAGAAITSFTTIRIARPSHCAY